MLERDPDVRELIARILIEAGHDVVDDAGHAGSLVVDPAYTELLDRALALKRRYPQLRIVCLSIAPPEPHVVHALAPAAYLQKPFRRSELLGSLRQGAVVRDPPEPEPPATA